MPLDTSKMYPAENFNIDKSRDAEVKEYRKKMRNRQSAQRARDRQKARMRFLEREVALLTLKNQALHNENLALKKFIGNQVHDHITGTLNTASDHPKKEKETEDVESFPLKNSHKSDRGEPHSERLQEFGVFPFNTSHTTDKSTSKIRKHPCGSSASSKELKKNLLDPMAHKNGDFGDAEIPYHLTKSRHIEEREECMENEEIRMLKRNGNDTDIKRIGEVESFPLAWKNHMLDLRSPSGDPLPVNFYPRFLVQDSRAYEDGKNTMTSKRPSGIDGFVDHGKQRALMMQQTNAIASLVKQGNALKSSNVNSLYPPFGGLMATTISAKSLNLFSPAPLLFPYHISQAENRAKEESRFGSHKRYEIKTFESENCSQMSSESDISIHSS